MSKKQLIEKHLELADMYLIVIWIVEKKLILNIKTLNYYDNAKRPNYLKKRMNSLFGLKKLIHKVCNRHFRNLDIAYNKFLESKQIFLNLRASSISKSFTIPQSVFIEDKLQNT